MASMQIIDRFMFHFGGWGRKDMGSYGKTLLLSSNTPLDPFPLASMQGYGCVLKLENIPLYFIMNFSVQPFIVIHNFKKSNIVYIWSNVMHVPDVLDM